MLKIVTLALSLAILIQNTCPLGLAAKTGFASPHSHCCCARQAADNAPHQQKSDKQVHTVKGAIYVFIAQHESFSCSLRPFLRTGGAAPDPLYRSITLNPPEEPPRLS